MKLKALVITALFLAGVAASVAVAKGPPEGKGKNKTSSVSTTGGTTTDKHSAKKSWICHKTGNGRYVKIRINKKAWPAHQRHGDVLPLAAGGSTTTVATTASVATTTTGTTTSGKKDKKVKQSSAGCPAAGSGGTTSAATTTTAP